jgi:hypothetical protein
MTIVDFGFLIWKISESRCKRRSEAGDGEVLGQGTYGSKIEPQMYRMNTDGRRDQVPIFSFTVPHPNS